MLPPPVAAVPASGRVLRSDAAALRARLQASHFEVECTLRRPLHDAPAIAAAREAVADALAFDGELAALATAQNTLKGRLFQALLEELRARGAEHAQMDNSHREGGADGAQPAQSEFASAIGHEAWLALAGRADALRNLVRVKVQDDNDLKTAAAGLAMCQEFFDGLSRLAAISGGDEYAELQSFNLTA